jgi:GAF domain-containing protein
MTDARKAGRYQRLREQLEAELTKSDDPIARMATAVAILHAKQPQFSWTGFYRRVGDQLVVGPYQGSLACQNIDWGKGVCGNAAAEDRTLVIPDVHAFPGHIACDARSRSEIVVPCHGPDGAVIGVLDVDATVPDAFDDLDALHLEAVVAMVFPGGVR